MKDLCKGTRSICPGPRKRKPKKLLFPWILTLFSWIIPVGKVRSRTAEQDFSHPCQAEESAKEIREDLVLYPKEPHPTTRNKLSQDLQLSLQPSQSLNFPSALDRVDRKIKMSRRRDPAPVRRSPCSCLYLSKRYVIRRRKMLERKRKHSVYQTVHFASQDHSIIVLPLFNELLR